MNTASNIVHINPSNESETGHAIVSPEVGKLLTDKDLVVRATSGLPERISEAEAGKLYTNVYRAVTERDARPEAVCVRAIKAAKRDVKVLDILAYNELMAGDSLASEIARKAHAFREAKKAERKNKK